MQQLEKMHNRRTLRLLLTFSAFASCSSLSIIYYALKKTELASKIQPRLLELDFFICPYPNAKLIYVFLGVLFWTGLGETSGINDIFLVATLSSVPLEMSDSLPICFSSVFIRYYFNILLRKQNKLRNYYFSYINLIELRYRSTEWKGFQPACVVHNYLALP